MQEVVPGVHRIKRTWGCNVYIIPGESPLMIDAGFPVDFRRVEKRLRRLGVDSLLTVVATHYHLDHTGAIHRLADSFELSIAAHSLDAPVMEGTKPYDIYKLDILRRAYYKVLSPLFRYQYVDVDLRLEEGYRLEALGGLEVIHLPGHTEGSIGLYQADRGILFSGDTIRNENGVLDGPPSQFTPDLDKAYEGISRKVLDLDFEVLLPGHGEPVTRNARRQLDAMMARRGEK